MIIAEPMCVSQCTSPTLKKTHTHFNHFSPMNYLLLYRFIVTNFSLANYLKIVGWTYLNLIIKSMFFFKLEPSYKEIVCK